MEPKHPFRGVHILGEMYGIAKHFLNDSTLLADYLTRGIEESGATLCSLQVKQFDPSGVSILALLSESHTSIHTYPEFGALFFDAFTCGDRCAPQRIAAFLAQALGARHQKMTKIVRGDSSDYTTKHSLGLL